jgi:hypothetical protein
MEFSFIIIWPMKNQFYKYRRMWPALHYQLKEKQLINGYYTFQTIIANI